MIRWCIVAYYKVEFSKWASLWATNVQSKFIPAPAFGKTGMSHKIFDNILCSF